MGASRRETTFAGSAKAIRPRFKELREADHQRLNSAAQARSSPWATGALFRDTTPASAEPASPFEPREANNRARCLLAAIWVRGAGIVHKEQVGLGIGRSRSVVRSNPRVDLRSESHGPR